MNRVPAHRRAGAMPSRSTGAVSGPERGARHEPRDYARLVRENERLADENDALRASAEIWIRMYEGQVERAKRTSCQCAAETGAAGIGRDAR